MGNKSLVRSTIRDDRRYNSAKAGAFGPAGSLSFVVIAGGGGSGNNEGSGAGGAGGYLSSWNNEPSGGSSAALTAISLTGRDYGVSIGAGGAGGVAPHQGNNGNNTVFDSLVALGGGAGARANNNFGSIGGSGGGNGGNQSPNTPGITNQGFAGGTNTFQSAPNYGGCLLYTSDAADE